MMPDENMANTKMGFQPTEDEVKAFERTHRGTINRRIEPQPWSNGAGLWMWRHIDSPREWDVAWVDGMADDMLDVHCPFAKGGRVFWASPRGLKAKAESVRAEKTADGWMWVVMWRAA
jgi:hypothetical protein